MIFSSHNSKNFTTGRNGGKSDYQMSLYRVLLVEDDFDDQMFSKKELMRSKNVGKVVCFPNGRELLQYLDDQIEKNKNFLHIAPIAIVLDLDMPLMNGFEVLDKLKTESRFQDIIIIVVTGEQKRWDLNKAANYKTDAVFKKPLDMNKLGKFFDKSKHWLWDELWPHEVY